MAVSYDGRTYAEGKKINWKDGLKAIYCILHYNLPYCPSYIQFMAYIIVGSIAAAVNVSVFLLFFSFGMMIKIAAPIAFVIAAAANYVLSIIFVFAAAIDVVVTKWLLGIGLAPAIAKLAVNSLFLAYNFIARRYLVFPLAKRQDWRGAGDSREATRNRKASCETGGQQ
jgi:putative flippase GtrA